MNEVDDLSAGYLRCAEGTARATRVRRLGSLPIAIACGCCDIGEADVQYDDGDRARVLITWGRNLRMGEQEWHIDTTVFRPVWVGSSEGRAELILCPSGGDSRLERWLREGLKMFSEDIPWECVPKGGE
jgi:hypothetical protein